MTNQLTLGVEEERPVMGLDIGSASIKCGVGVQGAGYYDIIAAKSVPSVGIRDGEIENQEELRESLREVIRRTLDAAACDQPPPLSLCLSSQHYYTVDTEAELRLNHGRVTHEDVLALVDRAHRPARVSGYALTHLVPQSFWIDGEKGSLSPWGQPATRLRLKGRLFYAHAQQLEQLRELAASLNLEVEDIFCDLLVQSEGCLNREELGRSVVILDIGSCSSKLMFFQEGRPGHFLVHPEGSSRITQELQRKLSLEGPEAERLKRAYGQIQEVSDEQERIPIQGMGPSRSVRSEHLNRVISRVVTEMLSAIRVRLDEEGMSRALSGGVILTGGGAQLPGIVPLAENILRAPVRLGLPVNSGTCSLVDKPPYAALNGLLLTALHQRSYDWFSSWKSPLSEIPSPLLRATQKKQHKPWWRRLLSEGDLL